MEIGVAIKQYRDKANISLRDFAAKCGTSHSYIAMLESGKNSKTGEPIVPTITMLKKIAHGMDMSVNDLIAICDDMPVSFVGTSFSANLQLSGDPEQLPEKEKKLPPEPKLSEEEKELLEIFRLIPEDMQKLYLEMGRAYANSLKKG